MSKITLERKTAKFLESKTNIGGINFHFFGTHINHEAFQTVAKAMQGEGARRIYVKWGTDPRIAAYDFQTSTMLLPRWEKSEDLIELGALIVHEAVHAYHHLKGKSMLAGKDEGAAYLAQAFFLAKHKKGSLNLPPVVVEMAAFVKTKGQLTEGEGRELTKKYMKFIDGLKNNKGQCLYDIRIHYEYGK